VREKKKERERKEPTLVLQLNDWNQIQLVGPYGLNFDRTNPNLRAYYNQVLPGWTIDDVIGNSLLFELCIFSYQKLNYSLSYVHYNTMWYDFWLWCRITLCSDWICL
jgi:hypothetical protein